MHIIGITGLKRSGKDTIADFMLKELAKLNPAKVGFADALKKEIATAIGKSREYIEENKDNFRLIMQGWGTDFRRKLCGEDYWVRKMIAQISMHHDIGTKVIIIPDVRFLNEAQLIRMLEGKIVGVVRGITDAKDSHLSETELKDIKFDCLIENEGSLEDLQKKTKEALKQIL